MQVSVHHMEDQSQAKRARRLLALVLCVLLVVLTTFASALTFLEQTHNHDHDGFGGSCVVCTQVEAAARTLKTVASPAALGALGRGLLFAALVLAAGLVLLRPMHTPVGLKVRLNH